MSVRAVAYRRLADKAANGDGKALMLLLTLANQLAQPEPECAERAVSSAENDAAIITEFLRRRARQEERKI